MYRRLTRAVDNLKEDLCAHTRLMIIENPRPFQVRANACGREHGMGGV